MAGKHHKRGSVLVIGSQTTEVADAWAVLYPDQTVIAAEHGKTGTQIAGLSQGLYQHVLDVTDEQTIQTLLAALAQQKQSPELVIILPPRVTPPSDPDAQALHLTLSRVEQQWRLTAYSAFLVAQAAIRGMRQTGGTLVFVGHAEGDLADADDAARFAGLRTLVQSLAREFQPQGIHIAHVQQVGEVAGDTLARLCDQLHRQPRDVWAHEVDLTA